MIVEYAKDFDKSVKKLNDKIAIKRLRCWKTRRFDLEIEKKTGETENYYAKNRRTRSY